MSFTLELLMPLTHTREITPAKRLDDLRYAIRDLAVTAEGVVKQGHKVLYLNVGDPNIFDFVTPAHVVEAACRAMRDNKNGYAPSTAVLEALEAIRAEAARKGITSVQDVFCHQRLRRSGGCLPDRAAQRGRQRAYAMPGLSLVFGDRL